MKRFVCAIAFILVIYCGESFATRKIKTAVVKVTEKINTTVSVYYGSVGTRSVRFMIEQFYPVYLIYGNRLVVELIPFGQGELNNATGKVCCHFGVKDCFGNKAQACVIDVYPAPISTNFVVCAMKSGDASLTENLQYCANENNITWSEIDRCIKSERGDKLLYRNGLRTLSVRPKIKFIPTVIFNHVYDEVLQKLSLNDFQEIVEFLVNESDCKTCRRMNNCANKTLYSFFTFKILFLIGMFLFNKF